MKTKKLLLAMAACILLTACRQQETKNKEDKTEIWERNTDSVPAKKSVNEENLVRELIPDHLLW